MHPIGSVSNQPLALTRNPAIQKALLSALAEAQPGPLKPESGEQMMVRPIRKSRLANTSLDERSIAIAQAAKRVAETQRLHSPEAMELSGASIPAAIHLRSAASKVLKGLHKIPEIAQSHYWNTLKAESGKFQQQLCQDFINAGQPIAGRVRIDSVVSDIRDNITSAKLVEFEPHCGADVRHLKLAKIYHEANEPAPNYEKLLVDCLRAQSPNENGKIRYVQWPDEERKDIDYHVPIEKVLNILNKNGLDAKQFNYNDPNADYDQALVYRLFEFSEIHRSPEQQALVQAHNTGKLKLANPAFAFGKLVPLFITEFPDLFSKRLGMTQEELNAFPYTISVKQYLESPTLREQKPFNTLYLKGVFGEGSGGGNDVHSLKKFTSWEQAKEFIEKTSNDESGGWILQEEVPRFKMTIPQVVEGGDQVVQNVNASFLQRQVYLNGDPVMHVNISTSRLSSLDDIIHSSLGAASFI